jgi:hypothetical protein
MKRLVVALIVVGVVPAITCQMALAKFVPAPQYVRAACHGDAKRLCAAVIENPEKRRACMREHHAELSAGCKAAIAKWRGKEGGRPTSDDSTNE